ncbi:MAG: hypothetical protein MUC88_20475 [Planctomycetes bacterium]|jgi:hypothetical protein|nr:hypothetical protein [Planctomycetota bacterium]
MTPENAQIINSMQDIDRLQSHIIMGISVLLFAVSLLGIWAAVQIERLKKRATALEASRSISHSTPATY